MDDSLQTSVRARCAWIVLWILNAAKANCEIGAKMKRPDISRVVFNCTSIIVAFVLTLYIGIYSGATNNIIFDAYQTINQRIENALDVLSKNYSKKARIHSYFLQQSRYEGEGVTVNEASANQEELILLAGFFEDSNELRLIQRDGTIVARWPVKFSEIFHGMEDFGERPASDLNVAIHGALALPDGSIVFNFDRVGVVKIDRCGKVLWKLGGGAHHSVERAEGGGFWVPGRKYYGTGSPSPFPPFSPPFAEDHIMKISDDGKIQKEMSVVKLFYEHGLETLLTANGESFTPQRIWSQEIVHLNKIAELSSDVADDFPMFEAGDLALSFRKRNLVMVVDPETQKIKWLKIGPWIRQHDPEFKAGGTIVLFNNNTYHTTFLDNNLKSPTNFPCTSNIIEINPATGAYSIVYGNRKGQEMLSVIQGKLELAPGGGLLITEFEGGRVFETDSSGDIIWEYINRYDSDEVAEITEARVYPAKYFNVSDWSCY